MKEKQEKKIRPIRLRFYTVTFVLAWTLLIIISIKWNLDQKKQETLEIAKTTARVAFEKDIVYRRWNALHGGVYVPITENTPPNEYTL